MIIGKATYEAGSRAAKILVISMADTATIDTIIYH
jgi:hypothetical protein